MTHLIIRDLHVKVNTTEVLKGINLEVERGKIHVLMGPNGAGKSTLSHALMGNPKYAITKGQIILDGEDITHLKPHERARKGLFLSFQYPQELSGVTLSNFLRTAYNSLHTPTLDVLNFSRLLKEKMALLRIDPIFSQRSVNEGHSGGEKKKNELLQLLVLQPKYAVLDECDSGLDVNALKTVGEGINKAKKDTGILLVTHYPQFLKLVIPDRISIIQEGKIVETGGRELISKIEEKGFKEEVTHLTLVGEEVL